MEGSEKGNHPEVAHVQEPEHHENVHASHHREFNVVPLSEEAVQDAVHINLSWRSWVCSINRCRIPVTGREMTNKEPARRVCLLLRVRFNWR